MGYSTEGGEATAYLKEDEIKKMNCVLYGESGKRFLSFYYEANLLIFVLDTRYRYNVPMYWNAEMATEYGVDAFFDEAKTNIEENRYYFKDNKIIHWLADDKKELQATRENIEMEAKAIVELSNNLRKEISGY